MRQSLYTYYFKSYKKFDGFNFDCLVENRQKHENFPHQNFVLAVLYATFLFEIFIKFSEVGSIAIFSVGSSVDQCCTKGMYSFEGKICCLHKNCNSFIANHLVFYCIFSRAYLRP